jgi:hypothetical protein
MNRNPNTVDVIELAEENGVERWKLIRLANIAKRSTEVPVGNDGAGVFRAGKSIAIPADEV